MVTVRFPVEFKTKKFSQLDELIREVRFVIPFVKIEDWFLPVSLRFKSRIQICSQLALTGLVA